MADNTIKLGFHMSVAGSVANAPLATALKGYTAFQIFSSSPRKWEASEITREDSLEFKSLVKKNDLAAFAHLPYLSNPSSTNPEVHRKSIEMMIKNIDNCNTLGIDDLVVHIGSHLGTSVKTGMKNVCTALQSALDKTKSVRILLENSAGYKNSVGSKFEEIGGIIDSVGSNRVGVCLDTCHVFAAGYDFRTEKGVDRMAEQFDSLIGIKKIGLVHLNDSKYGLGSGLDRHWHIGRGHIGQQGFIELFKNRKFARGSFIMETPMDETADDVANFNAVKEIIRLAGAE
jgi:deoxyribonuclease-4